MRAKISTIETRSLSELCNWRDSIWKVSKSRRRHGKLGWNASLYEADISVRDGRIYIDNEEFKGNSIYVNRIENKLIDKEFTQNDIKELEEILNNL